MHAFAGLKVEKAKHQAYEDKQPVLDVPIVAPHALIGIEVEVENITGYVPVEYYWTAKADGSLRNNGVEFTSIPLRGYQIPHAIRHLNKCLYENNKPDFSNRCSIHVHLNVRDMTWDEIKTLVLLYSIFERHFFNIAGTKRETGIFCVPLYKTDQLNVLNSLEYTAPSWYKYNAINCGTILGNGDVPMFGTIEFRHLYGTTDEFTLMNWINNIMCLRKATQMITYQELLEKLKVMNTTSEYVQLYVQVFGTFANLRLMQQKDFEYCVTQSKLSLWGADLRYPYKNDSALAKIIYGMAEPKKKAVDLDELLLQKLAEMPKPHTWFVDPITKHPAVTATNNNEEW